MEQMREHRALVPRTLMELLLQFLYPPAQTCQNFKALNLDHKQCSQRNRPPSYACIVETSRVLTLMLLNSLVNPSPRSTGSRTS